MVIAKYTLARLIVTYYWAFVFCSFVFACIEAAFYQSPGIIGFSIYLFDLVVGGLVNYLLFNKLPNSFLALRDAGALKESAVERFARSPINQLEKPLGHSLGIVLSLSILWFYRFEWKEIPGMDFWNASLEIGIVTIDLLLAYAAGVAISIVAFTAWGFRHSGQIGELHIRPFHPDRCAGLRAIGQLFFFSSLILVVIALFFGGWLLFGGWVLYGKGIPDFDESYLSFLPWFSGTLVGVGLVSVAVFFLPLLSIHRMMKIEASEYKLKALPLVAQLADLEASLVESASSANYDELDTRLTQIKSLRDAYLEYQNIPTWPVDFQTSWQFVAAQLAVWVPAITLADKVKSLVSH